MMRTIKKRFFIGFIICFLSVSSVFVIPIILHNKFKHNQNNILTSDLKSINIRTNSKNNNFVTEYLVNNLIYINKYINSTLIIKEKLLRLSILGGRYDKSSKYQNDKKRKRSELAQFSHALKHVHRYADQTHETINNSINSLNKENSVISQVISILNDHPYTYNYYLNESKISIPNTSFFTNKNYPFNTNNLNHKLSNISNSNYIINKNNTKLNNILLSTEESNFSAKSIVAAGSSIYGAAFKKITFQAKIITFNKTTNSFEYETPTAKEAKTSKISSNKRFDLKNSVILNGNYFNNYISSYFNLSRTHMAGLYSLKNMPANSLPTPEIPNYLPDYFNNQLPNVAVTRVRYNHISLFKNNESLYIPTIILGPQLLVFMSFSLGIVIGHIPVGIITIIKNRKKISNEKELNNGITQIDNQIKDEALNRIMTAQGVDEFVTGKILLFDSIKQSANDLSLKSRKVRREKIELLNTKKNDFIARALTRRNEIQDTEAKASRASNKERIENWIGQINVDDIALQVHNCNTHEQVNRIIENIIESINNATSDASNKIVISEDEAPALISQLNEKKEKLIKISNDKNILLEGETIRTGNKLKMQNLIDQINLDNIALQVQKCSTKDEVNRIIDSTIVQVDKAIIDANNKAIINDGDAHALITQLNKKKEEIVSILNDKNISLKETEEKVLLERNEAIEKDKNNNETEAKIKQQKSYIDRLTDETVKTKEEIKESNRINKEINNDILKLNIRSEKFYVFKTHKEVVIEMNDIENELQGVIRKAVANKESIINLQKINLKIQNVRDLVAKQGNFEREKKLSIINMWISGYKDSLKGNKKSITRLKKNKPTNSSKQIFKTKYKEQLDDLETEKLTLENKLDKLQFIDIDTKVNDIGKSLLECL